MTTSTPREVLLFGLSANPPTGRAGHMGVVAHCRPLFDEVWLLPVYQHIYSSKRQLAPFHHRVEMCRLAIAALEKSDGAQVKVVEEEREMFEHLAASSDQPHELRLGSIDLVLFLLERHPNTNFTMVLGGDTYVDLLAGRWKRGEELMRLVKLLVVDRKGVDSPWRQTEEQVAASAACVRYVHVPELSEVSSTMMRASPDRELLARHLDAEVVDYIVEHQLYAFASEQDKEQRAT
ncbi:hypothetical protein BBJ28_00004303 [Nothophytophthora sp. Chile5]|nr:hypothetical protein BBJ28_00004303 [Nothophytophthora sp. Chile5]